MSGQYPAICCNSAFVAASGEPGKTMPPTVFDTVIRAIAAALPQRSIARVRARRTRASSNGLRAWFGVISAPQFQSLSCTVI